MTDQPEIVPRPIPAELLPPGRYHHGDDAAHRDAPELAWYWQLIWRRRWTASACFLAAFSVVLIATVKQERVYLAKGSVEVELPQGPVENLFEVRPTPDSYLATQVQILGSATLTSAVMDKVFPVAEQALDSSSSAAARQDAFLERLRVSLVRGTRMITVSFEDTDPRRAALTVNTLMQNYLEGIRRSRSATAETASDWLLDQLKETKAKLEKATAILQRHEQENPTLPAVTNSKAGPPSDDFLDELSRARASRMEKESLYRQSQAGGFVGERTSLLGRLLDTEASLQAQTEQLSARFGLNYPRLRQAREELAAVQKSIEMERQRTMAQVAAEYHAAVRREALVQADVERRQRLISDTAQQILHGNMLRRDVELTRELYDTLLQRLGQAGVSSTLIAPNARVIDAAEIPSKPIRPNVPRNLSMGFGLGLSLAFGVVLLLDLLQITFKSAADVEEYLRVPLLGIIPAIASRRGAATNAALPDLRSRQNRGRRRDDGWFRLDRDGVDCFEMNEALRNLRTSLLFSLGTDRSHSLLFTSAVPGEGKTTTSSNLSIALAQLGRRVLLIDADLRRPRVHRYFSGRNDAGLTTYLLGKASWRTVVFPSDVPSLDVISSGGIPQQPVELLSSDPMRDLIREALADYDFVVVDSPILVNMADSRVLASYVDGVVLIVKSGATPRKLVRDACKSLWNVQGKILGVVLNHFDRKDEQYSYAYSYSDAGKLSDLDAQKVDDEAARRAGD
jgi:capsular exopolysaccharide synthesis family protein